MKEYIYSKNEDRETWAKLPIHYKVALSYRGIKIGIGAGSIDAKKNHYVVFFDPDTNINYADIIFYNPKIRNKFKQLFSEYSDIEIPLMHVNYSTGHSKNVLKILFDIIHFINAVGLITFNEMKDEGIKDTKSSIESFKKERRIDVVFNNDFRNTIFVNPYVSSEKVPPYLQWNRSIDDLKKDKMFFPYKDKIYGMDVFNVKNDKLSNIFRKSVQNSEVNAVVESEFNKQTIETIMAFDLYQSISFLKKATNYFKSLPSYNEFSNATDRVKKLQLVMNILTPFSMDVNNPIAGSFFYSFLWIQQKLHLPFDVDEYNIFVLQNNKYFVALKLYNNAFPIFVPVSPIKVNKNTFFAKDEYGMTGIFMKNTGIRLSSYVGVPISKISIPLSKKTEINSVKSYISSLLRLKETAIQNENI